VVPFEGDGRVRYPSIWAALNDAVGLGDASLLRDEWWLIGFGGRNTSIPASHETLAIDGSAGFAVRMERNSVRLGFASSVIALPGFFSLGAMGDPLTDRVHLVGFLRAATLFPTPSGEAGGDPACLGDPDVDAR
jgi:hypothetical protein